MTMNVELQPDKLKQTKWWEYLIRFLFGGIITALTGVVAHVWGPAVAGLFLAFPAILPASATLVDRHEGRGEAERDAAGAAAGSVGLCAFALVVWKLAARLHPVWVLALASLAWLAVSVAMWRIALPGGRRAATR